MPQNDLIMRPIAGRAELDLFNRLPYVLNHEFAEPCSIPARNNYNPIIAYLGVVPAHRGNGHIDDLLAEGTRTLAAHDVPRIRASTDVGNVPMARAFERAGYVDFQREINLVWS